MSRATIAQLAQLGLDSYATNQMDEADLQAALDAASDYITGVIAPQFPPPILAPYPMDLIQCECIMASWNALLTRGYNPASGQDTNIKWRYDQWLGENGWLQMVARGEIIPNIISAAAQAENAGASGPSVITSTQRGYSERGVAPFITPVVDTDPFSNN